MPSFAFEDVETPLKFVEDDLLRRGIPAVYLGLVNSDKAFKTALELHSRFILSIGEDDVVESARGWSVVSGRLRDLMEGEERDQQLAKKSLLEVLKKDEKRKKKSQDQLRALAKLRRKRRARK